MEWSEFQLAIFENVAHGEGHTVVNAVAGAGKTTVLVEAAGLVPEGKSTLFVAFNKVIADTLAGRLADEPHVTVSTLHSYGLRTVTNGLGRLRIYKYRVDDILRQLHGDEGESKVVRRLLSRVVSLAKSALAHDAEAVDALVDAYGLELPGDMESVVRIPAGTDPRAWFVAEVVWLLERCRDVSDGCLDFDDMVWLPVVLNLKQRQYDRVFLDEAQDTVPVQLEMVLRSVKPDGRIFAVRDINQEIYQFRGSDSRAFDRALAKLGVTALPLSVSYRCSRAVVAHVRGKLPHIPIKAAPGAPEGEVRYVPRDSMELNAKAGDFILSRTNAPLIGLCLRFLRAGRRANIQGRDVGENLGTFVKKSGAKSVQALRDHVEEWCEKECARLAAKRRDTQVVEDRAACLLELSDGAADVRTVLDRIDELFSDRVGDDCIVLSSTHKAKGLERDRVWMLVGTYVRRPGAEEANLFYVASTRARQSLFLVEGFEKKRRRDADDDGGLVGHQAVDEALS